MLHPIIYKGFIHPKGGRSGSDPSTVGSLFFHRKSSRKKHVIIISPSPWGQSPPLIRSPAGQEERKSWKNSCHVIWCESILWIKYIYIYIKIGSIPPEKNRKKVILGEATPPIYINHYVYIYIGIYKSLQGGETVTITSSLYRFPTLRKTAWTKPPSWAWMEFFFWWVGLAADLGLSQRDHEGFPAPFPKNKKKEAHL